MTDIQTDRQVLYSMFSVQHAAAGSSTFLQLCLAPPPRHIHAVCHKGGSTPPPCAKCSSARGRYVHCRCATPIPTVLIFSLFRCVVKLKQHNIEVLHTTKIKAAAAVDVVVFDKTGTLTGSLVKSLPLRACFQLKSSLHGC